MRREFTVPEVGARSGARRGGRDRADLAEPDEAWEEQVLEQRGSRKDYARFIGIARGSLAETQTFLLLAVRVGHLTQDEVNPSLAAADELSRMLTRLKRRLDGPPVGD